MKKYDAIGRMAKTKMKQLETALDIAQTCTKMFEDANKTAADLRQSLRECLEERLIKRTHDRVNGRRKRSCRLKIPLL